MGASLGLERQRMSDALRGLSIGAWHSVLRVPIDAVRSDLRHQGSNRVGPGFSRVARSLVPHHHGEENANAALVKIRDHLTYSGDASWHAANHVVLVAVVDAYVGISRPDQDGIDSSETLHRVIDVPVNRIPVRDRIVKKAVLDHHLRLNET